jgi:tRNA A-37 threonylcarbamoyl transferase component Bud32
MTQETDQADPRHAAQRMLDALQRDRATVIGVFKHDRRSRVALVEHEGRRWSVKDCFAHPIVTWLAQLFRMSPAWREAKRAAQLEGAGIRVNRPVLLRHRRAGGQVLVFGYIEGRSLYHELFDDPPPARRGAARCVRRLRIARAVGAQMGAMIAAGLVNRDHKPSNLIIDERCRAGRAQPVLIDPLGVRATRDFEPALSMLLSLLAGSYRAGGATRRERLTALVAAMRQADLSRAQAHQLAVLAAAWLDEKLGDPPPRDTDRRPADHASRQSL